MRIKRFIAPDMRTALRMIRDEQGPDAVILSNRAVNGGIEVVAATDYDEALATQALRAAAPGLEPTVVPMATISEVAMTAAPIRATDADVCASSAQVPASASASHLSAPLAATDAAAADLRAPAAIIRAARAPAAHQANVAAAPRESLIARARAVFKIGEGPTLAELSAAAAQADATTGATRDNAATAAARESSKSTAETRSTPTAPVTDTTPAPTRFEAMMAALNPAADANESCGAEARISDRLLASAVAVAANRADTSDADYLIALSAGPNGAAAIAAIRAHETETTRAPGSESSLIIPARTLHAVTSTRIDAPDPTIVAMRNELAGMRQLMETQMEQLSLERLRGSPARAAAFDALIGCGCEPTLAQAVAAKIDPRLSPEQYQQPMFAELARMLTITRSEPLDDGGVIALVGPTGAGKTSTTAKLAARFAARHRARDVALVTTDGERTGAREQLHALGRRLGITVCDADNGEALGHTLDQLVDYPLVLVDTAGYGVRDRAVLRQILWLRTSRRVRSLLVLPANAHPHDLGEVIRRYRPAAPEAVVLTKLDETGRLGAALSVLVQHDLSLAYTSAGQQVPADIEAADAGRLVMRLEKTPRAAVNPLATENRHAPA